jgi:RNA polymerase sigma-70 factor (ECF subfamily)
LYHRYSNRLGRCLTRYLGDASLAEDALQDSFLQLHRKRALYRDGCPARPWLYAVAIHRAVDTLRRARKLPMISLDGPPSDTGEDAGSLIDQLAGAAANPLEALQNRERQQWVRESMDRLPEPMRQVLALAYDRELSYAEIASVLGTPLGTVKSRLHAAIGRLREMAERCDKVASR